MLKYKKAIFLPLFFILTAIIVFIVLNFSIHDQPDLSINGTIYPQARNILPFNLTMANNQSLDDYSIKDHWSVVFFGYTNCPDICPTTLNTLNDFYHRVTIAKLPTNLIPNIIFVSLDPARDEINSLSEYTKFFNPNFIAASGTPATIQQLIKDFGVVAVTNKTNADGEYFIDHSSHMFLLNPQGQIQAIFTAPHKGETLAKDYINIVKNIRYG